MPAADGRRRRCGSPSSPARRPRSLPSAPPHLASPRLASPRLASPRLASLLPCGATQAAFLSCFVRPFRGLRSVSLGSSLGQACKDPVTDRWLEALALRAAATLQAFAFVPATTRAGYALALATADPADPADPAATAAAAVTGAGIRSVLDACPRLVELRVCLDASRQLSTHLGGQCSRLTRLELAACWSSHANPERFAEEQLGDAGLAAILGGCRALRHLKLSGHRHLTGVGVRGCPDLQTLLLAECASINDDGIGSIAQACPKLHTFEFRGITCQRRITDRGVGRFARRLGGLRVLSLKHTSVTDAGLRAVLASTAGTLRRLAISSNRITGTGFCCAGAPGARTLALSEISVAFSLNFSDQGLKAVGRSCPLLQSLDCHHCPKLTGTPGERARAAGAQVARRLSSAARCQRRCRCRCPLPSMPMPLATAANANANANANAQGGFLTLAVSAPGRAPLVPVLARTPDAGCAAVYTRQIRRLNLKNTAVTDDGLLAAAEACARLEVLSASSARTSVTGYHMSDGAMYVTLLASLHAAAAAAAAAAAHTRRPCAAGHHGCCARTADPAGVPDVCFAPAVPALYSLPLARRRTIARQHPRLQISRP